MSNTPKSIKVDDHEHIRSDLVTNTVPKVRQGAWTIGEKYLIRTVTMTWTGLLEYLDDKELVLSGAAWIADAGRYSETLKDASNLNEVEPAPNEVVIGRGAIVDAVIWNNNLPREVK